MNTDQYIEQINQLSLGLIDLKDRYKELMPIVAEEHRLLKNSDLDGLEKLVQHKSLVCDQIVKITMAICHKGSDPSQDGKRATLEDIIANLSKIPCNVDGIKQKIIDYSLRDIRKISDELRVFRNITQQKVEMNIYLTRKLLDHHRKVYDLWNDVAEKSAGVYSPSGQHSSTDITPVLRVKA